jgi:DNA-binding LytR/AlgR family response regulator
MKRLFLPICLVLIACGCLAQPSLPQADSLTAALRAHPQEDSIHVQLLIDLIRSVIYGSPDSAMKYSNEVLRISGLVFVPVTDIIRCESDVNYTTLHLRDRQKLVVAKTLKEFEELLADYNFFRVHNSHLINLAYVKSYNKGKGGSVTMTDLATVAVSTRRKEEFLKKLSEG